MAQEAHLVCLAGELVRGMVGGMDGGLQLRGERQHNVGLQAARGQGCRLASASLAGDAGVPAGWPPLPSWARQTPIFQVPVGLQGGGPGARRRERGAGGTREWIETGHHYQCTEGQNPFVSCVIRAYLLNANRIFFLGHPDVEGSPRPRHLHAVAATDETCRTRGTERHCKLLGSE